MPISDSPPIQVLKAADLPRHLDPRQSKDERRKQAVLRLYDRELYPGLAPAEVEKANGNAREYSYWSNKSDPLNVGPYQINLKFTPKYNYSLISETTAFTCAGWGPCWYKNSCAFDSVIVVCLLLDAGFVVADEIAGQKLSKLEADFLDLLAKDWNRLDVEGRKTAKEPFLKTFHKTHPELRRGEFLPVTSVWSAISKPFHQFRFHYERQITPCPCTNRTVAGSMFNNAIQISPPLPKEHAGKISIHELLKSQFHYKQPCRSGECKGHKTTTSVVRGELPDRLVVVCPPSVQLTDHTSQEIDLEYTQYSGPDKVDEKKKVRYRWVCGIYCYKSHFRVYGRSQERWSTLKEPRYCVYDSKLANGAIVNNLGFAELPSCWVKETPPLLFLERVDDRAVGLAQAKLRNVLHEHFPARA